ncbi:DUF3667 domain-containing protein [Erythrobacter rubeus]|uniref:DUF3667 domain-containing protein n=1 Tax=Erythrobacter rubeus TaxID=2760803 RepID=A0ABR8KM21_9SPHN|nr:DUF3667 domain-containing protein [Erythrobacter rubeus]MBD2840659.1 DUF3667 domain-containing protein [Erythrobacter rubeus]
MNDISEGIGGAIEGGLVARAVEPKHGETGVAAGDGGACLNCGADPLGPYCQSCGQKQHVHRTLSAMAHDLVHGVLHLDGKFWRTLPLLVFKPGQLTRRYIEGERAKFVSPMAMFLFSVFAMFAVFQALGITAPTDLEEGFGRSSDAPVVEQGVDFVRSELQEELDTLPEDDPRRAEIENEISELDAGAEELAQTDSIDLSGDSGLNINLTGIDSLDKGLVKKWQDNPGLMLYKLQANGYKFSWLLIPLSVPFVWLTFAWRRRFKAYDHAVFVTYSLGFMSLLFIVASAVFAVEPLAWLGGMLIAFVPPIHLYKQLRHTYDLGRFSALWRLLVLSVFIWIVVALFLQALLVLGAF